MKKRLLSIFAMLMSLVMLVTSIPLTVTAATSGDAWNGTNSDTSWDGAGTSASPYLITSAAELKGLSDRVNGGTNFLGEYFKQTADIDLGGKDWTPIGTSSAPFKGNYNGGGYTISNLHVDEDTLTDYGNAGLFGYVDGGRGSTTITIENLSVIGGEIQTKNIEFAYNSSRVVYSPLDGLWQAGVIAAYAQGLTLNNVYTDVDIYPSYNTEANGTQHYGLNAGGLIGCGRGQININSCVAMGDISFYYDYATVSTTGSAIYPRFIRIGGLIGSCAYGGYTTTTRSMNGSFYTGTINVVCNSNNTATRVGGLAGEWINTAVINNCYMLGNVNFISSSSGQGAYAVGTVVGFMGTSGGGDAGTKITNTKIYNQYENSNIANNDVNYFYKAQPVGKQGTSPNGEISVSTITGGTNNPITLRSSQYGIEDSTAFRLLATISSLEYKEVGYTITAVAGASTGTLTKKTNEVYESIFADNKEYFPQDKEIGGNEGDYIVALAISDIPQSGIVAMEVAPYVTTQDEKTIYGNTAVLLFNNGKMMNCYGLQNDKEADRITALGADLSNFKIVYDGTKTSGSHVAAPDLYHLILKNFGIGLDVEKKTDTLPTHCIYLKETSGTYGNWTVTADENNIYINANDICGFSAGVSHLIAKLTADADKNIIAAELTGSGSLQSRTDYDNGETANGNFAAFKPVYTLPYTITNAERTLSYHKALLDNPAGQTVVYAHRGEHKYYPEASLEAYISAWYSGASIVDVDIQQTADGVWVCMHNTTLNATTNVETEQPNNPLLAELEPDSEGKYYLKDWTYAELQQLSLLDSYGQVTPFKIPKLLEVLKACEGNVYVGLDDKTETNKTPSAHRTLVLSLGISPVGLMLRSNYSTNNSYNDYNGVKLPSITNLGTNLTTTIQTLTSASNTDVTKLMIPASNPDYFRYVSVLLGTDHFTVTRQYKDQVRFFTWMQYRDNDTPAVWAEAEANGYDTFGTNYCIALMEYVKSKTAQN